MILQLSLAGIDECLDKCGQNGLLTALHVVTVFLYPSLTCELWDCFSRPKELSPGTPSPELSAFIWGGEGGTKI